MASGVAPFTISIPVLAYELMGSEEEPTLAVAFKKVTLP